MAVDLKFGSMDDFDPARVAKQVPALEALLETREKLRDLMSKADRSEELESLLEQVLQPENGAQVAVRRTRHQEDGGLSTWPTQRARPTAAATTTEAAPGLLDQILAATKQTEPDRAQDLVKTLVEQALAGTVTFDRNLTRTFDKADRGDRRQDVRSSSTRSCTTRSSSSSKAAGAGCTTWCMNTETGTSAQAPRAQLPKRELGRDLQRAVEFDQSQLFKKIYENEFGTPGGEPYGALIGDYEWTNHPDDLETLRLVSNVAAGAFAPFISAAGAGMFGFDDWTELSKPRDLAKIFETVEYAKWRSFRDTEDSRFVTLVMPRVIARLPYGENTKPIDEFDYEEAPVGRRAARRRRWITTTIAG